MPAQRGLPFAVKRCIDVAVAGLGLAILLPVLVVIAGAIRMTMGSPVFFPQLRPGRGGRPFRMVKFRTMRHATSDRIDSESEARRLTALGSFLRKTSLDELPELWNVLVGDMSLVGPRPLLMRYLDRYTPEQARRHDVLPGVTGWAQVNGRNATTWHDRFARDVWYADHWSLRLDMRILAMTVGAVLGRRGISQPGQATMAEYLGEASTRADARDHDDTSERRRAHAG